MNDMNMGVRIAVFSMLYPLSTPSVAILLSSDGQVADWEAKYLEEARVAFPFSKRSLPIAPTTYCELILGPTSPCLPEMLVFFAESIRNSL